MASLTGQGMAMAMALSDYVVPYALVSKRSNLVILDRKRKVRTLSSPLDHRAVLVARSHLRGGPTER